MNATARKSIVNAINPFLNGTASLINTFLRGFADIVMILSFGNKLKQATRLSPLWRPAAFRHHLTVIVALSTFTNPADSSRFSSSWKAQHAFPSKVYACFFVTSAAHCCAVEKRILFLMRIILILKIMNIFCPIYEEQLCSSYPRNNARLFFLSAKSRPDN